MRLSVLAAACVLAITAASFLVASPGDATPVPQVSAPHQPAPVSPQPIPILVYHHLRSPKPYGASTWSFMMSVSPEVFEKQMQWIVDHGYTTINLDTYVAIMQGQTALPAKPVVITFDDNHASQYRLAVPILRAKGLRAVFYLTTNRLKHPSFILEDQVRQLAAWGMEIASHTVTHATLTRLSPPDLDRELQESKATLEKLTGQPVRHLAYPSTASNALVRKHAEQAGYRTATIMDPRRASPKDDLFKLPRITMMETTILQNVLP